MTVSNFNFKGHNRYIVIVPASASTPAGFQLLTFEQNNNVSEIINEISPHLVRDRNALIYARSLVMNAGVNASLNPRDITRKLCDIIERNLLRVYGETPKQQIQHSTETGTLGASSTNTKAPKTNKGKQTSASVQSGTVANHSPTEVAIDQQECRSDPVSMLSGEEILPLVDFELNGLMPLTWRRLYRSSKILSNVGMGYGWRHNFCVQLDHQYQAPAKVGPKKPGKYWFELTDDEGRVHVFDSVKRGQTSIQLSTGWSLVHQADGRHVLIKPDDSHWAFIQKQVAGKDVWQLETISNHQGQYFQLYYDQQGRLTQITTGPKRGVLLFYNAQSNLLKVASYMLDNEGNKQIHQNLLASYQYDDAQALIAATDSNGRVERYSYVKVKSADITSDSDHQYNPKSTTYLLQRRTRASGFSHHFSWDGQDQRAKCIEQWGDDDIYHYHFEYTALVNGIKSSCTDSLGHRETFIHNAQGLLTEHHKPNGSVIRHQYDAVGRKVATVDACDNKIQYNYNEQGQLLAVIQADGGTTRFEYNRLGQRIVTIDAIGRTAKRHYDATGRLLSESGFDGRQSQFQYNDAGQLTQKVDVNGVIHRYHWDRDGELLATQVGDALTRFSHDRLGRVNATINPQGLVTEFIRDNKGQIVESKSYPQDKQDQQDNSEEAISHYYQYDDAGRIIRQRQQADVVGEQELSNDSEYIENIIDYDGLAQPRQQTFADGSWLKFFYDKERNLNRIERSDGAQYRIEYTPTEQPKTLIGFDGREQHYQYDANDKLVAVNDSDIRFVELKRDAMGRICQQSSHVKLEPSATSALLNTQNFYQYNPIGQITRAHNQHRTVQQHLDAQGRINRVLQSQWQLEYQYDDSGNRSGLTLPDGQQIDYQYTKNSQLSGISVTGNGFAVNGPSKQRIPLADYHYLPSGLLHKTIQGNQLELTHAYDSHSRLIEQTWRHTQKETRLFESRRYQYDKQHQLQRCESKLGNDSAVDGQSSEHINHKPEVKEFSYNKISQLISNSHTGVSGENPNIADNASNARQQYQWDAFGNPLQAIRASDIHSHTHTQDISSNHVSANETASSQSAETVRPNKNLNDVVVNNDRLMSMAGIDYRYDASGNQISQVGRGDKQQRSFNGLNQLVQINVNGKLTQYEYDALGRRSAKITELGRTDFIWDNHQLIGECILGEYSWYIYQPDTFTPVALIKAGKVYYYHLDQLGTPICLTDENTQIVWRRQQDVFGQTIESTSIKDTDIEDAGNGHADVYDAAKQEKITNPIRFQGQYFDDESGLHYNRFRYYSPQQARFIHQDPIGLIGGINHYQYAPNPVNWVDPFGLCKEDSQTYAARKTKLANSNGTMTTLDAFTDDSAMGESWDKAAVDENWLDERRLLHADILNRVTVEALSKVQTLVGLPAIHAMRGNTGAGKSRLMKSGVIPELALGDIPVINPDNIKPLLIDEAKKDNTTLTHDQTHWEAAMLSDKLKAELLKPENKDKVPSIIVDKRLGGLYEIKALHKEALATDRQVNVFDVDAPLEMSLLGVLMRKPGGDDPIVPFHIVAGGFQAARKNRKHFVSYYEENPSLGRYELYGTASNGDKVLVAKVYNGELVISDIEQWETLAIDPTEDVKLLSSTIIDTKEIERVTSSLPEGEFKFNAINTLKSHKGMTWKQAITKHGEIN
ncbi:RHS domain-containing protein [Shewanella sp. BF02_Schw]|uniref:RHS repeat-associated core domain-containing protein n=1 Tax=Shewanella sp. BF02_Schw TaxID=394908 RepID=UPI001785A5A2|nr:RHS repeat-associated core domain-containing protein [Shewanella sp. BF02_Schw]MBO1895161.1 RHS domain-containing protein [Shewanella sp. BF02_Schw]